MSRSFLRLFSVVAAFGWLLLPLRAAEDWPQWRGPTRDGRSTGKAWPSGLSERALQQQWRVELGPSYSGPVVVGGRVFTTETRQKRAEVVQALDRLTGKVLWSREWEGAMSVPFFARSNGDWIRSTPACDGERLYVAGMRDVLVCLRVEDGSEVWRRDFVKEMKTPLPDFGFVCSPLVEGEAVYVQAAASLVKLNKRTGEVLWRALQDGGGMWGSAFSSPVLATLGGKRQLVVQTREKVAGVDPESGKVWWTQKVEAFRGMNILTPVVQDDLVFTSTYGGKTIGYRVQAQGDVFSVEPAWTMKSQGYMSTPVVVDGVAYHHLRSQRATAVRLSDGKELWTTSQSFGKYWSLVVQGDRVLALDQKGMLYLFRADPEKFDLIDSRRVSEQETWAHLAVSDGQVFVRELNGLVVFRWAEGS